MPAAGCEFVLTALLLLLLLGAPAPAPAPASAQAQSESPSSSSLMPLDSAYGYALERFEARAWSESAHYLQLSLRLHRLLRDGERDCSRNCSAARGEQEPGEDTGLWIITQLLARGACLKKCKANLPVLSLNYPSQDTLDAFQKRLPYRYLQYANFQLNNLEKAISAAHTYLQRNPGDQQITKYMNYYKSLMDVEPLLLDHEERAYEPVFVRAVRLYNSGDYSGSVRELEQALVLYLQEFQLCLELCEGSHPLLEVRDFYNTLAGLYTDVLKCQVQCEENLVPNVGGYFVEKFVATMYHYMQFAYYKLSEVRRASRCAASYLLFDAGDQVMQQNMQYYKYHKKQYELQEEDFTPRPEALQYYNRITKQKEMLEFARNYLQTDDEDEVSEEEAGTGPSAPPDQEFEGLGDYEESFLSDWWQEPRTKGDTGESE